MIGFDEALHCCVDLLTERLGESWPEPTIVRDPGGVITVVLPDDALPDDQLEELARELDKALDRFSPGRSRVLLRARDLVDPKDVFESPDRSRMPDVPRTWLLDRLLTNQDWLRPPLLTESPLPVCTAFSIKGGVGRTTALGVLAWYFARRGRRVVVVDLDLEAPGLASLLLPELPDRGLADWLVERTGAGTEAGSFDQLLADAIAISPLGEDSPGRVDVVAAFGQRTKEYVAKLGRVYLPGVAVDGTQVGLRDHLAALIDALGRRSVRPDAILLDARAGMHDLAAAAVTQLGAEVFIFGRDEPQAWQALRLLFEHLRGARSIEWGAPDSDLRRRLHMVAAQIGSSDADIQGWSEGSYAVWESLFDAEPDAGGARPSETEPSDGVAIEPFLFGPDDRTSPHFPIPIYFDDRLRGTRFADRTARISWEVASVSFGKLCESAEAVMLGDEAPRRPDE